MQYCPKCKTEYEDHATTCVDCNVDLVPNLEDHTFMKDLVRVKVADSEQMIKYLEYSGISKYETIKEGDALLIRVAQEDYESAVTYLKVYIHENMEEDDTEDYYMEEYASEVLDTEDTVSEMKSTVTTFGVVGAGALILAILNYLDIVSIGGFNKTMFSTVLGLVGLLFIGIAVKTHRDIDGTEVAGTSKEAHIDGLIRGYTDAYSIERFYDTHKIKKGDMDEGALYFMIFDVLKKEVKKMYPDEPDTIINTVVERVYDLLEGN